MSSTPMLEAMRPERPMGDDDGKVSQVPEIRVPATDRSDSKWTKWFGASIPNLHDALRSVTSSEKTSRQGEVSAQITWAGLLNRQPALLVADAGPLRWERYAL